MDFACLEMQYATHREEHTIRMFVRAIDTTPLGALNDYSYLLPNGGIGAETTVLGTFAALGATWSPYYPNVWSLSLIGMWSVTRGQLDIVSPLPLAPPISGSAPTPTGVIRTVRRTFRLYGQVQEHRQLWLQQIPGDEVNLTSSVTPGGGGFDSRDVSLITYLSGAQTACLTQAGTAFQPVAVVRQWWDRPMQIAALNIDGPTSTTAPPAGAADALPLTPAGYITVLVNGTLQVLPYY